MTAVLTASPVIPDEEGRTITNTDFFLAQPQKGTQRHQQGDEGLLKNREKGGDGDGIIQSLRIAF